jgi:putative endonuclease
MGLRDNPSNETHDRRLGREGERAAAKFLRRSGYRILGRNVRTRVGEADLVCEAPDRATVVIVEVKTRGRREGQSPASATVAPEASITSHKRQKLRDVTRALRRANRWFNRPVRIDVVAVEWNEGEPAPATIRHHVNAVGPD